MKYRSLIKYASVPVLLVSQSAFAIDLTAVTTGIDTAVADGSTVGVAVVGGVAALIVVGVVITMVKKLTA